MFQVGRVCVKIAGRDAGKKCVIVKHLEGKFYLIDGETRRRKCNTLHLEPLDQVVDIREDATHEEVMNALGLPIKEKKQKIKSEKPSPKRKSIEKSLDKKSSESKYSEKKSTKKKKE
ncbi:MAG: hypothetical protein KatS3mg002_0475 [Candidatus Woesearchaeota archaeon]|nr:MAG: hypothetical protein KatS3mg002_0475 [Candidatus Woesearchaeota archaeon]